MTNQMFWVYWFSQDNVFICTVAPHWDWLSYQRDQLRISQNTNTWINEFETQPLACPELSRRCSSMSNWYSASGWALCSLLGILWWNHWKCQLPCMSPVPVSCAINTLVVFKRHFCCDFGNWKLTLGSRLFTSLPPSLSTCLSASLPLCLPACLPDQNDCGQWRLLLQGACFSSI